MRRIARIASCLALSGSTLSALAQDAPRRGRPDGDRPAERGGQPGERGGQPGERGAQPGGPRNMQLSPEKAKAAWELTAAAVAKRLAFTEDQTTAVVKAYVAARESHTAAAEKMREGMRERRREGGEDEGGDMRARAEEVRKAAEDMNTAEREKFSKALTEAVGAEAAGKAVTSLGVFAPNWDRMVDVVAGFKLEAAKQQEALNAVETFIVSQAKIARDADREERQAAMREGREKLLGSLKGVLTEDQLAKFEQSMGGGRGRGGEGGGRPGRGGA